MKIYRTVIVASGLTGEQVERMRSRCSGLGFEPCGTASIRGRYSPHTYRAGGYQQWESVPTYSLTRRAEFLHDHTIDGKTLARLLPAWAKPKRITSIGPKVTEFYRLNAQVVTDMSGPWVGTEEWRELQDDPHRAAHLYLFEKYGMYSDEFEGHDRRIALAADNARRLAA